MISVKWKTAFGLQWRGVCGFKTLRNPVCLILGLIFLRFSVALDLPLSSARFSGRIQAKIELVQNELYDQLWDNQRTKGEEYELELVIGRRGSEPGEFLLPGSLDLYEGELFVVDAGNYRIQVFSAEGEFRRILELPGIKEPFFIRFFSGHIYVADKGLSTVLVFSQAGQLLEKIGDQGVGEGQLNLPNALAIDAEGLIWVSDERNNRVEVFSPEPVFGRKNSFLMSVDQYQPEQYLSGPKSVCYASEKQQIYVIDSGTARILAFDSFGNFIGPVLDYAAEKSRVFMPQAIQLDNSGWLYVADHLSHTILLYTEEGIYRGSFGHAAQFPAHKAWNELEPLLSVKSLRAGDFVTADSRLRLPSAISVQDDGDVWVSDWGNNAVKKFSASFYRKALEFYKKRDFLTAITYFEKCNSKNESYHLVEFYLAMCHYYLGAVENLFENKIKHFAKALNYLNVLKLKGEIGIIKNRDLMGRVLYYLSQVQVYIKDN